MTELVGVGLVCAFTAYVLNAMGFGGVRLFLVFSGVVMLSATAERAGEIIARIIPIIPEEAGTLASSALRVLGIGYVGGFFSDVCFELGARGASDALSLFMRIEIAAVALPYLIDVISLFGEII